MKFSMLLLSLLLPLCLLAQKDLPRGMAPQEWTFLQSGLYDFPEGLDGITTPPPYPVRAMAEWEELQALTVTWTSYKPILAEIIGYAKAECEVIVVCSDSNQVKNELINNYFLPDLNNISFLQAPYNSVWIRDYGPNCVYANEVDSLYIIDWIYNRPRPKDDLVPEKIAEFMNIPIYSTTQAPNDLVHTGGNFMPDGMGTVFSEELLLDENGTNNNFGVTPKTEAQVDQIMNSFMGVDNYIKVTNLPYDGIHHIDMHFYLLDEETILLALYPEGVADGPQIEANLQYILSNYLSPFGTPYKVVRIQSPPSGSGNYPPSGAYRTYANLLFINKTVLVPTYDPQYDNPNLDILRAQLPGYKVYGIDCNSIIGASGALHCITKPIGVADPLLIQHQPLEDVVNYYEPFEVNARIQHRTGISGANLYFTTDTTLGYTAVPMTLTDPTEHTWTGYIPGQLAATEVFYYVEGVANSGKTMVRPMPAPASYWNFQVDFTTGTTEAVDALTEMAAIFPNPANAITCIPIESKESTEGTIELVDILGRTVHTIHSGSIPQGKSNYFLQAQDFEAGTYYVRLQTAQEQLVQKVIIK
ncbi:MAG: agmatine deiminase family protein [Saprospirales bacterium]|nr:agmatine deiminase family protein [Saprospirales bacterium]